MSQEKIDKFSISDLGKMMEKLLGYPEYVQYLNLVSRLRDEALYSVLSINSESVRFRERLRTLDEVIGIPDEVIKRAKMFESQGEEE